MLLGGNPSVIMLQEATICDYIVKWEPKCEHVARLVVIYTMTRY